MIKLYMYLQHYDFKVMSSLPDVVTRDEWRSAWSIV